MTGDHKRCSEIVWVRDTYRVNRGPGAHFKMHYRRQQCSRDATVGDHCWQHDPGRPSGYRRPAKAVVPADEVQEAEGE